MEKWEHKWNLMPLSAHGRLSRKAYVDMAPVLRWMRAKCLIFWVRASVTLWRVDWKRDIHSSAYLLSWQFSNITQSIESKDYFLDSWHPHSCNACGFFFSTDELSRLRCPLQETVLSLLATFWFQATSNELLGYQSAVLLLLVY